MDQESGPNSPSPSPEPLIGHCFWEYRERNSPAPPLPNRGMRIYCVLECNTLRRAAFKVPERRSAEARNTRGVGCQSGQGPFSGDVHGAWEMEPGLRAL